MDYMMSKSSIKINIMISQFFVKFSKKQKCGNGHTENNVALVYSVSGTKYRIQNTGYRILQSNSSCYVKLYIFGIFSFSSLVYDYLIYSFCMVFYLPLLFNFSSFAYFGISIQCRSPTHNKQKYFVGFPKEKKVCCRGQKATLERYAVALKWPVKLTNVMVTTVPPSNRMGLTMVMVLT